MVYAFAKYSVPLITDLAVAPETLFMSYFPPWPNPELRLARAGAEAKDKLYNFKYDAASMYGYKHTHLSLLRLRILWVGLVGYATHTRPFLWCR